MFWMCALLKRIPDVLIIRQGFGAMTRALMGVSEGSRVVLALEGGYDPRGVADCVVEVVAAMAEGASGHDADELVAGMGTRLIYFL